ncbi:hypothetical protein KC330_g8336 [Hortaea werneckii]|nr:hypothetical protein KC330_g8336 [Hortaea werneckii]
MPKHPNYHDESGQSPIQHARDWSGPEDPGNPRNFPLWKRVYSTFAVSFLAFVTTFAASIYSPGSAEVQREFDVSQEVAVLPLCLYNAGLAAGPIIGAPLSETAGRKVVTLATPPLFALFTLGAGFSQNAASLIVCRFFAGVFAAPAVGNASATITDYTAGRYRAISMAFYYSIPTFGAMLGPLVGGFAAQGKGWRWTQWTTIFFIVAFYIPTLFTTETYKKAVLRKRARQLGIEGPPRPTRSLAQSIHHFATNLLFRPINMLLTEPIVTLVCLYNGFLFGLLYTFVVASPWVYEHYYDFGPAAQNLSFLGLILGTGLAPIPLIAIDHFIYQPRWKSYRASNSGDERFPPEHRLYPALFASFALPAFLFAFAWSAEERVHWIVPIIFQFCVNLSSLLIYAPANLYMMDSYGPLYGASAASAAMLSRYTLSTVFPLFSLQMFRALGVGWATSLLAFCTLAMAPIPWLFWRCGERLRSKGKFETSN